MNHSISSVVGGGVLLVLGSLNPASGQGCAPGWFDASQNLRPQINAQLPYDFIEFDRDGSGPLPRHLYVSGGFTFDDGMVLTPGIARWDGIEWTSVAQGLGAGGLNFVFTLASYDADGAGPSLPVLVAGGLFANAGNIPVRNIARWDGIGWQSFPGGPPADQIVYAVEAHDPDGPGPQTPSLIVAGSFLELVGGIPARNIARWNGSAWSGDIQLPPATLATERCFALHSFDPDGDGTQPPILLAWQETAPGWNIIRWTGVTWEPTGLVLNRTRGAIYDTSSPAVMWDHDGNGPAAPALHVCDSDGLRRWTSGGWSMVPSSAGGGSLLAVVDEDGPGPQPSLLYSGTLDFRVVRWDGASWSTIGTTGPVSGGSGEFYSMAGFDNDGPGPQSGSLFVGGSLGSVSGVTAIGLARYGCDDAPAPCLGDVNSDLAVNFDDITDVLTFWGAVGSPGNPAYGDANNDDSVGFTDITAVLTSWGQDCTGSRPTAFFSVAPIIEPDANSPMGQLLSAQREEGHAGVMRMLADWPSSAD